MAQWHMGLLVEITFYEKQICTNDSGYPTIRADYSYIMQYFT